MSADQVFHQMKFYHQETGRILSGGKFLLDIANKYPKDAVIEGLMLFNDYLDEQRNVNQII